MDVNKLAILTNQLGGYDQTENVIGVDAELIQRAVAGESLTPMETAEIETGFNQLYLDPDLAFENNIEVHELEGLASDLAFTTQFLYDADFANTFREGVANDTIDPETLDEGGPLFANLTRLQTERIAELIGSDEGDKREQVALMFDAYLADHGDIWDVDESAFWEWYRETFYKDE